MTGRQPEAHLPRGALLRAWRDDDVGDLLLLYRDALVRHYAPTWIGDVGAAREWIRSRRTWWGAGDGGAWALEDGGRVVGAVTSRVLDGDLGVGSVGYSLAPAARGRGLATAGTDAAARLLFDSLGWTRLELYHAVENAASCAVARRAGFPLEGTMRRAMRYADGRWSDEHLHARLASDPSPQVG